MTDGQESCFTELQNYYEYTLRYERFYAQHLIQKPLSVSYFFETNCKINVKCVDQMLRNL
ncbi:hypothetical protein T07_4055 [Trichinella nelsoni]|uniref:Uncharacterized protein n=1 Tax=Trichinella nelsoni TaxID=6336 RepID=A0A0V0SN75_9BILA|nr:hypothetical protein T07_4055 [Trichinella nelsoni]